MRFAISPGHVKPGDRDTGAVDPAEPQEHDIIDSRERDWTLRYALAVVDSLRIAGEEAFPVIGWVKDTVHQVNTGGYDAAISIHFNAAESTQAHGVEAWIPPAGFPNHEKSRKLALRVLDCITRDPGQVVGFRGVKDASVGTRAHSFAGKIRIPGALLELGFLTNVEEEKRIVDPLYRLKCAVAVTEGLIQCVSRGIWV